MARQEVKFRLLKTLEHQFCADVERFLKSDHHIVHSKGYAVRSVYFDSLDFECFYQKLSGVENRCKVRVRGYYPFTDKSGLILEFKSKNDQWNRKERKVIDRDDYEHLIRREDQKLLDKYPQEPLIQALVYFRKKFNAYEAVTIDYNRKAYVFSYDSKYIRITLDSDLRFLRTADRFYSSGLDKRPSADQNVIVEFKFEQQMPFWMQTLIQKYSLYQSAISKYALAVQELRL